MQLRFRALRDSDLTTLHALHSDPATNLYNPGWTPPTVEKSAALLDGYLHHLAEHGFGYHLALDGDIVAGICGARHDLWRGVDVLNLYWRLMPEYQGRALSAQLAGHAFEVARSAPGDALIVARTLPANVASIRVAERLGLTRRPDLDARLGDIDWVVFADRPAQT